MASVYISSASSYTFLMEEPENIVELQRQHGLPQIVQRLCGIGKAALLVRISTQELGIAQRKLHFAVEALVGRHGGIGTAMVFQIQFTAPLGQAGIVLYGAVPVLQVTDAAWSGARRVCRAAELACGGRFRSSSRDKPPPPSP